MFADIGNGTLINLALIVKVQVINMGASGTVFKFYSSNDQMVAEYCPATPEDMERILGHIRDFRQTGVAG
jgi:phenylacetate-coenzyme A ligase PaaK-like adenylate-forming protein